MEYNYECFYAWHNFINLAKDTSVICIKDIYIYTSDETNFIVERY